MTRLKFSTSLRKPCTSDGEIGGAALPPPLLDAGAEGGSRLDGGSLNAVNEDEGWAGRCPMACAAAIAASRALLDAMLVYRSAWDTDGDVVARGVVSCGGNGGSSRRA